MREITVHKKEEVSDITGSGTSYFIQVTWYCKVGEI
jgi:hypothetical protein